MIEFGVLGGVTAGRGAERIVLPGQVRRLLGILLAERGTPVSTSLIVERLWDRDVPATATQAVYVIAGRLRRALEPRPDASEAAHCIRRTADGYEILAGETDLDRYEWLVERSRADNDPAAALETLTDALRSWTGRPWGDQANEPWLRARVELIEERHRRDEERWAELVIRVGRHADALPEIQAAANAEPLREHRWAQLILALYRSGRQGDALRAYDSARCVLRDELGVEPGIELQRIHRAVLHQLPDLEAFGSALDDHSATSFVGRSHELDEVTSALGRQRLVTIVGMGGVGKTRLVDAYAQRCRASGTRVHRVMFASLTDPRRAAHHAAHAMGISVDDDGVQPADVLAAAISERDTLLVFDRIEHISAEAAALAMTLIDRCPRLRVVATSRVPIGIAGERTVTLAPLTVPEPGAPLDGTAVALLADRLGLDLGALDAETSERLRVGCLGTGGIPLLVELAAASGDRFDPRQSVRLAAPPAGAGYVGVIREAITHAMDAVEPAGRQFMFDSAVLPAGFSDELAARIAGFEPAEARRVLRQLGWSNLLQMSSAKAGVRYYHFDPVSEALLAQRTAEDNKDARLRATIAVGETFRTCRPTMDVPPDASRLDALDDEHDNLRFALRTLLEEDPRRAVELAIIASDYWPIRGHLVEGRRWINAATAAAGPTLDAALESRAVVALACTTRTMGEIASLRPELETAVTTLRDLRGDPMLLGLALVYLGIARGWQGDRAGSGAVLIRSVRALDRFIAGDPAGSRDLQRGLVDEMLAFNDPCGAVKASYLAAAVGDLADLDDIDRDLRRTRELATQIGDVSMLAQVLLLDARVMRRKGDTTSRAVLAAAADELVGMGGLRAAALARRDLGLLELQHGEHRDAHRHLVQALPDLLHFDRAAAAAAAGALAVLAWRADDTTRARQLARAASALRASGVASAIADESLLDAFLAEVPDASALASAPDDELVVELAREIDVGIGQQASDVA